ncbi:MAG: DUF4012 domain-containing protein, partial [Chloroflexia bacterium]
MDTAGSGKMQAFSSRASKRVGPALVLLGLTLILLWFGLKVWRLQRAVRDAGRQWAVLQQARQRPPQEMLRGIGQWGGRISTAAADLATLRAELRILDPLLTRLGWVPHYGPEIAALPHLSAMAADLAGAGADLTAALSRTVTVLESEDTGKILRVAEVLQEQLPLLSRAHARLQHAAYERTFLDPYRWDDSPLADLKPLLEELDRTLPGATRRLGWLVAFLPHADTVLGKNGARRYLLVGQNNYELRATGGFMGSMGTLLLENGEIRALDYRRSYDWDNPHREKIQPPLPYVRYMRFGAWFIRDANFAPDFPTTARTLQMFWEKDGHEPVDGVIAVDLTAVQMLLEALGPVEVPGYGTRVGGSRALETI